MLVDESYFIGPLEIAQLGQKAVVDKLKDFINRYEPVIMEAALGYDFYQAFLDGLDPGSDEVTEQRWIDLRDGLNFTNAQQMKRRWGGFALPLTEFIYYEYMKDMASQNTGLGYVKSKSENSQSANPVRKPIDAFNDAARQIKIFWQMMQADQEKTVKVYPEFDPMQVGGYSTSYLYSGRGGLYGYTYGYGFHNNSYSEIYSFMTKNTFGI